MADVLEPAEKVMTPLLQDAAGIGDPVYKRVRELIRQDIFSGYFEPGTRIKTAVLGARYGVSQMPIREALQQLQWEGLVIIAPNRGASVRTIDADFIRNIYDIRTALQSMMVRRSVQTVTETDMFALQAIEGRFEDAARRRDTDAILAANKELHEATYRLAANPEAVDVIARHSELLVSLRRRFDYGAGRLEEIVSEHRQLLAAFAERDVTLAAAIIEQHCEGAKFDLLSQAGFTDANS